MSCTTRCIQVQIKSVGSIQKLGAKINRRSGGQKSTCSVNSPTMIQDTKLFFACSELSSLHVYKFLVGLPSSSIGK